MCLAGQDMTPAAPSTLVGYNKPLLLDEHQTLTVGYNKPLQVNDDALTRVGHNKPLLLNATTSATAGSTATPPKADPMEIAALELLLAEPANCHDPCGSPWMMEDTGGVRASTGRGRSIL